MGSPVLPMQNQMRRQLAQMHARQSRGSLSGQSGKHHPSSPENASVSAVGGTEGSKPASPTAKRPSAKRPSASPATTAPADDVNLPGSITSEQAAGAPSHEANKTLLSEVVDEQPSGSWKDKKAPIEGGSDSAVQSIGTGSMQSVVYCEGSKFVGSPSIRECLFDEEKIHPTCELRIRVKVTIK